MKYKVLKLFRISEDRYYPVDTIIDEDALKNSPNYMRDIIESNPDIFEPIEEEKKEIEKLTWNKDFPYGAVPSYDWADKINEIIDHLNKLEKLKDQY